MTTEWWRTSSAPSVDDEKPVLAPGWDPEPTWSPPPPVAPPEPPVSDAPEAPEGKKPDRRKTLLLGAAGAAVAGIIAFSFIPSGGGAGVSSETEPSASQDAFLPPAGGGAKGAEKDQPPQRQGESQAPAPKVVTMTISPSGQGDVGALVNVTIRNDTDETLTVMPSMMKGDGRPAMVGEGTLAPGSRRIEPGETAEGTIEFAVKAAPSQVVLTDLSGEVVAAS